MGDAFHVRHVSRKHIPHHVSHPNYRKHLWECVALRVKLSDLQTSSTKASVSSTAEGEWTP